jgi:hypothetical protein
LTGIKTWWRERRRLARSAAQKGIAARGREINGDQRIDQE